MYTKAYINGIDKAEKACARPEPKAKAKGEEFKLRRVTMDDLKTWSAARAVRHAKLKTKAFDKGFASKVTKLAPHVFVFETLKSKGV